LLQAKQYFIKASGCLKALAASKSTLQAALAFLRQRDKLSSQATA
jgi:hypothetical protein